MYVGNRMLIVSRCTKVFQNILFKAMCIHHIRQLHPNLSSSALTKPHLVSDKNNSIAEGESLRLTSLCS